MIAGEGYKRIALNKACDRIHVECGCMIFPPKKQVLASSSSSLCERKGMPRDPSITLSLTLNWSGKESITMRYTPRIGRQSQHSGVIIHSEQEERRRLDSLIDFPLLVLSCCRSGNNQFSSLQLA